ncbi:hypothetical protein ACP70R_042244 [Stipagrostis hirtigluma subsp. patula]
MFGLQLPSLFRGSGRRHRRIYGPKDLADEFLLGDVEDAIPPVLAKIEACYRRAELDKHSLYSSGLCFGLLDPTSNIVINSVISVALDAPPAEGGGGVEPAGDMAKRSLDGLVAFLTYFFPYLPQAEALGYLDAADADPLVACLLLLHRRGMRQFVGCSATTVAAVETALRCAAAAAQHPYPEQLVLGWKLISPALSKFAALISRPGHDPQAAARRLLDMKEAAGERCPALDLEESWKLAENRRASASIGKELPPARAATKRMLLATIHRYYLQALSRLPSAELTTVYHRSLLMGGYCFGPLDPVSNIILNTVWYERTFPVPASSRFTLHMISTGCLWRVAARSLYGLVSFLCTRYPSLTPELAMERLHAAGAELRVADPNLFALPDGQRRGHKLKLGWSGNLPAVSFGPELDEHSTPLVSTTEAYIAAATAAFHPDPPLLQKILDSCDVVTRTEVVAVLKDDIALSARDLDLLSMLLPVCQPQEQGPQMVSRLVYTRICRSTDMFWGKHERVLAMVKAALDSYNRSKANKYKLHLICGVNELVSGPEFNTGDRHRGYNPWTPFKYYHSHINFLAACENFHTEPPILFFAECCNDSNDGGSWCIPLSPLPPPDAEQIRCIYCEHEGNRILHPSSKDFHGRDVEFEKVLKGKPLFAGSSSGEYGNDVIIRHGDTFLDWVHPLGDDSIYHLVYPDVANDEVYLRSYIDLMM